MSELFWKVAVNAPLHHMLTYRIPEELASSEECRTGKPVEVPLGARTCLGFLFEPTTPTEDFDPKKIKNISSLLENPALDPIYLKWLLWLSQYYVHPLGQILKITLPPLDRAGRGSRKSSFLPKEKRSLHPPELTKEQAHCLQNLKPQMQNFGVHLIMGVTGSGKTEIYLRTLSEVIASGKQGLFLVPEISLTPQLIQRFWDRFGDEIAVLHSQLTDRERTEQWWAVRTGAKKILLGARSALFCPLPNLGCIILDEEHEPSFKQDEKFRYQTRDAAIMLAKLVNCPVLLGSATPSLESWKNAQQGIFHLHQLKERVHGRAMPTIEVVDLRKAETSQLHPEVSWLSLKLFEKIEQRLQRREQVALFLNRRGFAGACICEKCGDVRKCPNCSVSLTLHGNSHLLCHYCDYHERRPDQCQKCEVGDYKPLGLGTERIETDLARLFPQARLARADRDEIQQREQLEELITNVEDREVDILIGTQMIAKGLDFPHLTLVGIVLADMSFQIPDFRAGERGFQLMSQMSGRAGRDQVAGEVVIQSFNPDSSILAHATHHDYQSFAEQELVNREQLHYPPFRKLACIRIQSLESETALQVAEACEKFLQQLLKENQLETRLDILGPVKAPLFRIKNWFRYQILLKADPSLSLSKICLRLTQQECVRKPRTKVSIDIDPLHLQ